MDERTKTIDIIVRNHGGTLAAVAAAYDAGGAAEHERLRVMLTEHLDQTVESHHVTLAECHAARNALQLVLDEWAWRPSSAAGRLRRVRCNDVLGPP